MERQELNDLTKKANSVNGRIAALQKQQAQAQQNPAPAANPEIAATQQRLQSYLAQAQTALQQFDVQSAWTYMQKANAELAKLEKFLAPQ